MQIEVKLDKTCLETKVVIITDNITEEVADILKKLSEETPQVIAGFSEGEVVLFEQDEIIRIYAAGGKVLAETNNGLYRLKTRLYELENRLDKKTFVRISNSEIINLKKAKKFDLSFAGTICVSLLNGKVTYVSRRYVLKIKQVLGI